MMGTLKFRATDAPTDRSNIHGDSVSVRAPAARFAEKVS